MKAHWQCTAVSAASGLFAFYVLGTLTVAMSGGALLADTAHRDGATVPWALIVGAVAFTLLAFAGLGSAWALARFSGRILPGWLVAADAAVIALVAVLLVVGSAREAAGVLADPAAQTPPAQQPGDGFAWLAAGLALLTVAWVLTLLPVGRRRLRLV